MQTQIEHGLGRKIAPDPRDRAFPMASVIPEKPERDYRYWWPNAWTGDQGKTSSCVAYAWTHWLASGPVTQATAPPVDPWDLYQECVRTDEFPGEEDDGTSIRAGAQALRRRGYIDSFWWATDVDTVVDAIITRGPVVFGTWWHAGMAWPGKNGLIRASGTKFGGHGYLGDGASRKKELIRIKNSHGRVYGENGFAYIPFEDMDKLLKDRGECCLAIERRV